MRFNDYRKVRWTNMFWQVMPVTRRKQLETVGGRRRYWEN